MKATRLYRIASVLLFVVAVGNTYGLLNFWHVAATMPLVRFPIGHADFSYAQVVLGYQVFCSMCILFAAYLAWHLAALARTTPRAIGALGWILFTYQILGVCISWMFFSGVVKTFHGMGRSCCLWPPMRRNPAKGMSGANLSRRDHLA